MRLARTILFFGLCGSALLSTSQVIPQGTYQVVEVRDGGTISGTVKWSGEPLKTPTLPITKDAEICDPGGTKNRDLERLVIGPDGGVENTVIYLADVTRGKAMDLPEARRVLDQKSCRYIPHVALVPADTEYKL